MKKIISILLSSLILINQAFATVKTQESDGSPSGTADILKFTNGSLTKSGNTFTVDLSFGNAPVGAQYLTLATDSTLTNERVLTAGLALDFTDGGAGSTLTVDFDPTELLGSRTWGDGSTDTIIWTWNRLSATDPAITFGGGNVNVTTGGLQVSGNNVYYATGTDVAVTDGGTGFSTTTTGDVFYASGTNTIAKLAVGTDGEVLKLVSGLPSWETDSTGAGGLPGTPTEGDITYYDGADWVSLPIGNADEVLTVNAGEDAPEWAAAPGTAITVQEGDVTVTTAMSTLDFGSGFDLTESPAGEVNVTFDSTEVTTILQKPQDYGCDNCKIVTSISSNDLVVALKGADGNDCSATNVCTVTIGTTVRTVTGALSATLADGTAWFGLSPESTAQDVDFFCYLLWDSNSSVVDIAFARIPTGRLVSDFSATTTNAKYISQQSNYTSTDEMTLIGRFNATLGVTATFLWTIPATSIIVNHPIYETRWMAWTPTLTVSAGTAPTYTQNFVNRYRIVGPNCKIQSTWTNSSGGTAGNGAATLVSTLPFAMSTSIATVPQNRVVLGIGETLNNATGSIIFVSRDASDSTANFNLGSTVAVTGNTQNNAVRWNNWQADYEI